MRVALTMEQCWHRVPGGTAVAAIELARELTTVDGVDAHGVSAWHRRRPRAPWDPPITVRRLPAPPKVLYDLWAHGRVRVGRGADVVHATTVLVPPTRRPLVATVHDLAFVHEPHLFTERGVRHFRRGLERIVGEAAVVCCSSLATMADCREAGIEADRLRHVPLGARSRAVGPGAVGEVRRRLGLDGPYLFTSGTLEPRKNLAGLCAALELLPGDLPLLVAGPDGWGDARPAALGRLGDRVRMLGFVSEADLHALYAGAAVVCYPSLREGFGLPVAEAMAHGAPVVTSFGTSTEEVAGGAAVLVDPNDPADIARGITEALSRPDELRALGRARAAELTWARTAALTVAAYRDALERG